MKRINVLLYVALGVVFMASCRKKLVEEPRSILTPDFFSTAQGFQQGLDAAYASTRLIWGNQDYFTITVIGTDEFKRGIDGNSDINVYSSGYTPSTGVINANWRNAYIFINSCNGVIDNAPNVDMAENLKKRMVAEAKFIRANWYFMLVQFWGDVTLNKTFQTTPTTEATRAPMAEVYDFIVQDLKDAMADLPQGLIKDVQPGRATKAAALHVLAKVYLTRGGSAAAKPSDYQDAYTSAKELIDNKGVYGLSLLPDFAKVYEESNEANSEVIFSSQHSSNLAFNGPNNSGVSNFSADNVLNHMWVPQYEKQPGMVRSTQYGRPYIRCTPTRWMTDTVFNDKVNDTRYGKTFQTVWYANDPVTPSTYPKWPDPLPAGAPAGAAPGQFRFGFGDTAIYMPGVNKTNGEIAASKYLLIPPRNYSSALSPYMKKYNDTKRANLNFPSIRSVIAYRLAETYLIAAEAAFRIGNPDAVAYINAIRTRAAYPTGDPAALQITPADLSIDFILDERSRELCGELTRWLDLVRTGKLLERVKMHNPEASINILPKHILRPIPQAQIDAVTTGEPYKQNEGWN